MPTSFLSPTQVRELCAELGVRPSKQLGQNFVTDSGTLRRILTLAQVPAGAHVLEIGPGLGSLTLALLEGGAKVSAIEIDHRLAQALPHTVESHMGEGATDALRVIQANALEILEADLPPWGVADAPLPTLLVANLPYNVAVPLVLHVLEHLPSIDRMVVMVQDEVARRLSAEPGGKIYGVPSLKVAWYARARYLGKVSRQVFDPIPNVDSALVGIERYAPQEVSWLATGSRADSQDLQATTFKLIDAAFAQRRKTLRQALAAAFSSPGRASWALQSIGIDPARRGETLPICDYAALAEVRLGEINPAQGGE